jgi:hypothetical protein
MAVYFPCTTIFTTSLRSPEKPILFFDFDHGILNSDYKDSDAVEYIDNEDNLKSALDKIKNNEYKKSVTKDIEQEGFEGMLELIEFIINKKLKK